jgi:hypothetical protein
MTRGLVPKKVRPVDNPAALSDKLQFVAVARNTF